MRWAPGFAVATEAGRVSAWSVATRVLPGLGLFTRVQGRAVLVQETRGRIHDRIQEQPGIHYSALRAELGLSNGVLLHHLRRLEREVLVRRRRSGSRVLFYPAGPRPVHPLPRTAGLVLRHVALHPGVSQAGLGRALGLTRQAMHYHVRQAVERGLVQMRREGRETLLRVPDDASLRLGHCAGCGTVYEARALAEVPVPCGSCGGVLAPLGARPT